MTKFAARKRDQPPGRTFDFELKLGSGTVAVTPRDMVFILHWLKSQRRAAQFIAPHLNEETYVASVAEFAAVARHFQATLTQLRVMIRNRNF